MKNYSKTGFIAYQTKQVKNLIDEGNFNVAKKIIQELIKNYPYDERLKTQLARIYTLNREYEEALSILEEIREEYVFMKKTALCIKLKKEDRLIYLYQKYFCNEEFNTNYKNNQKYNILKIHLTKKFDPNYCLSKENLIYAEKQSIEYSEELALDHIIKNHAYGNNRDKSRFSEHINITELFQNIKETIKQHPDDGYILQDIIEAFYIYYPECGKDKNSGYYDCIYVSTILGTGEILTMYPVSKRKNIEHLYLEEKTPSKKKIKVKTGLERFKCRYNIN